MPVKTFVASSERASAVEPTLPIVPDQHENCQIRTVKVPGPTFSLPDRSIRLTPPRRVFGSPKTMQQADTESCADGGLLGACWHGCGYDYLDSYAIATVRRRCQIVAPSFEMYHEFQCYPYRAVFSIGIRAIGHQPSFDRRQSQLKPTS